MRQMSFSATTPQFRARTKTVTRRLGWTFLKSGDRVMGVEKGQGLKKGEKVVCLGVIRIVSVRLERLDAISLADLTREGVLWDASGSDHPIIVRDAFIRHFCEINRPCKPDWMVTRIEFAYED